ncbi:hypothetical protein MNBD_GAMMA26-2283 [hydrothermal vent metagenome]|uniref:Bacterial membrane protein YfhO n=1 Tax=hydrothermal vent metagenome TaxID=652676 RepID=A0A3B1BAT4_9ZZZZ
MSIKNPHLQDVALLLIFPVIFLFFLWGPLIEGNALYFRDLQIFFIPMKAFLAEWLSNGVLPFWDAGKFMGVPYFADIQTGVLYPLSWLLLIADGNHGIGLLIYCHLLLASVGFYLFIRRLGLSAIAAFAGGLVYTLGGVMVSSFNMINVVQGLSWLPWILWAFLRLVQLPTPRNWVIAVICIALQVYAGWVDASMMTGLAVVWLLLSQRPNLEQVGFLRMVGLVASAYFCALLLAAPQLIATFELFQYSVRTGGLPDSEIAGYMLGLDGLSSLLFPPALDALDWEILEAFPDGYVPLFLSLYVGWSALALIMAAICLCHRQAIWWLSLGVLGLFLAAGENLSASFYLHKMVGIFRYPEKYVVLFHLSLAIVTAFGCHHLARNCDWRNFASVLLVIAMGCELYYYNDKINLLQDADYYDLEQLTDIQHITANEGRIYSRNVYQEDVTSVRDLYLNYRNDLTPFTANLVGLNYVLGTAGLMHRSHREIIDLLQPLPPSQLLAMRLAFFDVRYLASNDIAFKEDKSWRSLARPFGNRLWDIGTQKSDLYFPTQVVPRQGLSPRFFSMERAVITGQKALVETDKQADGLSGQVLHTERLTPNNMRVEVETSNNSLLVWSESHYPGWQVLVDGTAVSLEKVNYFFMGVWIPPGRHEVEFKFVPTGFIASSVLAVFVLILLIILALANIRTFPSRRAIFSS